MVFHIGSRHGIYETQAHRTGPGIVNDLIQIMIKELFITGMNPFIVRLKSWIKDGHQGSVTRQTGKMMGRRISLEGLPGE